MDLLPLFDSTGQPLHWVRTSVLMKHADPYCGCWMDIGDEPITLEEVHEYLMTQGGLEPAWDVYTTCHDEDEEHMRKLHVQQIAWLVSQQDFSPLDLDVGVPGLTYPQHIVQDGNHRLAAAIYLLKYRYQDNLLPLMISGSVKHAMNLGLWTHPEPMLESEHDDE